MEKGEAEGFEDKIEPEKQPPRESTFEPNTIQDEKLKEKIKKILNNKPKK